MSSHLEESIYDRTIRLLLHVYGIATSVALWAISIYVIRYPESWSSFQGYQFYMVLATATVTLFELIFILAFCPVCWCCLCCKLIDGWMRAGIYSALTIPIFIFTKDSSLAVLWASLLLILALLHLLKWIQHLFRGSSHHHNNKGSAEGDKKASNDGSKDKIQSKEPATNNYGATSEP